MVALSAVTNVALEFAGALELECTAAFADSGRGLLDRFRLAHDPDHVRHRDPGPEASAEEVVDGVADDLPLQVPERHLDGGLRVAVAADALVHRPDRGLDVEGVDPLERGRQQLAHDLDHGRRCLAAVAVEVAAPVGQRSRLAPADEAVIAVDADDHPAAELAPKPPPKPLTAHRQRDRDGLDLGHGGRRA
jgi:hypothetical protein